MVDVGVALWFGYFLATVFIGLGVITMLLLKLDKAFKYFKSAIVILILVSSAGGIMEALGYNPETVNMAGNVVVSIPSGAYVKTGTLLTDVQISVLLPEKAHWSYKIHIYVNTGSGWSEINYNKYIANPWALSGSSSKAFDVITLKVYKNFFSDYHEKEAKITMSVTIDGKTKTFEATGTVYDPDKMKAHEGGILGRIAGAILDVIYALADVLKFIWGGIGNFLGESLYYLFLSPMPDWYIDPTTGNSYFYEFYFNQMMPLFFFLLPIMMILSIVYRSMMLTDEPIAETFHDTIVAFVYAVSGYYIYEYSAYILNYIAIKTVDISSMGIAVSGALGVSLLGIIVSYIVPGAGFFFAVVLLGVFMLYAIGYLRFVLIASLVFLIPIVSAFYILPPLRGLANRVGSLLANLMFGGVVFALITRALVIVLPQSWYGKMAYLIVLPFIYIFAVPMLLQMLGFAGGTVFAGRQLMRGITQGLVPFAVGSAVGLTLGRGGGSGGAGAVPQPPVSGLGGGGAGSTAPPMPTTPVGESSVQLSPSFKPAHTTDIALSTVAGRTTPVNVPSMRGQVSPTVTPNSFVERLRADYSRYAPKTQPFQDIRRQYRPELAQPKEVTEALGGKTLLSMVRANPKFKHDLDLYSKLPANDVRRELIAQKYGLDKKQMDTVAEWYSENRDKFSSAVVGSATKSDFNATPEAVGSRNVTYKAPTIMAYASLTDKEKKALAQYFDLKQKVARGEVSPEALEKVRQTQPFMSGWEKMKAGAMTGVSPQLKKELESNPERLEKRIEGAFQNYYNREQQGAIRIKPLVNEKESILSRVKASPIVRDAKATAKYTGGLVAKGVVATGVLTKNVVQTTAQKGKEMAVAVGQSVKQNAPAFLYYTAIGMSGSSRARHIFAHYGIKPPHAEFGGGGEFIDEGFDEELWEADFVSRETEGL
ncbi:membrane protein of unknown function (plasmid) [Thermococcus nautili]|uniref:hypothetical protein n=1 Tax=Thermococcus nautili TaxID=195522 RepID=UPI0025564ADA|nr:hypothetical protein [Thermococcus nautili]CAI1494129.1 membrane protein of unknown function [Thermococcus nautili]